MFESILKYIAEHFSPILEKLNKTSVKRLLIYFMLLYPLVVTYLYKEEIRLMLFYQEKMVAISDVAEAQKRCFQLRSKYYSEAVSLYVYQPTGKNKTHKERMMFSTGFEYQPLESLRNVNLYSRNRIIQDLQTNHYAIITQHSKHEESAVLVSFNMNKWIITPVIDQQSGVVIAEVHWLFKEDVKVNIEDLINEGQIFSILLQEN